MDIDEWKPPTGEELTRIEERRHKADKESKILGDLLLRGWAMLDHTCTKPDCTVGPEIFSLAPKKNAGPAHARQKGASALRELRWMVPAEALC